MAKQDWTPEPWSTYTHLTRHERPMTYLVSSRDMRRACAAVNALAGLSPEGVAEAVEALRKCLDESAIWDDAPCFLNNAEAVYWAQGAAWAARAALAALGVEDE